MAFLDVNTLLEALSSDDPCGPDLEYEDPIFGEMERASEGKPERQYGDAVYPAEPPDWHALQENSLAILARSKDLRAAVFLAQAALNRGGIADFCLVLELIEGFVTRYWEQVHPRPDAFSPMDYGIRVNTLSNLSDRGSVLITLQNSPLVESRVLGRYSLRDIQVAGGLLSFNGEGQAPTLEVIAAAFKGAGSDDGKYARAYALGVLDAIRRAIARLSAIRQAVVSRLNEDESPDFEPLIAILEQARKELETAIPDSGRVEASADIPKTLAPAERPKAPRETAEFGISSREDVIDLLNRICRFYERQEPGSPVPLLLKRARRLVNMSFMDIVQDLAPDGRSNFDFLLVPRDEHEG